MFAVKLAIVASAVCTFSVNSQYLAGHPRPSSPTQYAARPGYLSPNPSSPSPSPAPSPLPSYSSPPSSRPNPGGQPSPPATYNYPPGSPYPYYSPQTYQYQSYNQRSYQSIYPPPRYPTGSHSYGDDEDECDDHSCDSDECCEFNGKKKVCVQQKDNRSDFLKSTCTRYKRCFDNGDCPPDHCCVVRADGVIFGDTKNSYGYRYGQVEREQERGECVEAGGRGESCRLPVEGVTRGCPCESEFECDFEYPGAIYGTCKGVL